eukprot:TRINITY_DN12499_c0_g1_i1.p1 TRINITY_DN12499_c0_g1~~TRINITY_DN12499_c0_g1_i1.p1  ORF type:complete len:498 (-),score=80.68 TRINITY_DN12499_c0_g1_i1:94-1563(-)
MSSDEESIIEDDLITETDFDEDVYIKEKPYDILSEEDVKDEIQRLTESITDILGLPIEALALPLLIHAKWNKEKLISSYMDDPQKTCETAGVDLNRYSWNKSSAKIFSCRVCLEDSALLSTFSLSCGHTYCAQCWKTYLEIKISEGPSSLTTKCIFPKCGLRVHQDAVYNLVSAEKQKVYEHYLIKSFVEDNPQVKWCPYPGCGYCVRCERESRTEPVRCKCSFCFCFKCADYLIGDHKPASCSQVEKWLQKASDESENVNWLLANTKKCPKCRSPIEKNGGCMHMTCYKNAGGCGYEFCWLCRGAWTDHGSNTGGYYACNKYDNSEAKNDDVKVQDVKTELELYMFYYHRYESHRNAMKVADEQLKRAQSRGTELQKSLTIPSQDTNFLTEATTQILVNRRVLEFSYVYGYYLDRSKLAEKNLFEYLQEKLECHTDKLSEIYETSSDQIQKDYHQFIKWREEVTNYTRVTKNFLDNFVMGVERGLTNS